jgi:hypothetical protein
MKRDTVEGVAGRYDKLWEILKFGKVSFVFTQSCLGFWSVDRFWNSSS